MAEAEGVAVALKVQLPDAVHAGVGDRERLSVRVGGDSEGVRGEVGVGEGEVEKVVVCVRLWLGEGVKVRVGEAGEGVRVVLGVALGLCVEVEDPGGVGDPVAVGFVGEKAGVGEPVCEGE